MANNLATAATGTMMDPSTGQPISLGAFGGFGRRRAGASTPISQMARPTGMIQPQMTGGSNARGYRPGRGLSVGEIMTQRENQSNAYDPRTGQDVARGTVLNAAGWDTSGVGPGTKGYRGSFYQGGYNGGSGTGRPSARTSSDFYDQRGSSLDRYKNNARTYSGKDWYGGEIDGFRQYGGPVRRGGRYLVGEDGPEVVVMPQEGYVTPNPRTRRPSFRTADEYYAFRDQTVGNPLDRGARRYGAPTVRGDMYQGSEAMDWASPAAGNSWFDEEDMTFGNTAVDRLEGASEPYHGEERIGRDGKVWRFDAKLGRGVPVSVYEGDNLHAPSPPVELMTPDERYNDIGMRLQSLREEAGRQFQDQRRLEESKYIQPKTRDSTMTTDPATGGLVLSGRYGRGTVNNAPVAKSFTVDLEDGTQGRYNNLGDASRESAAATAMNRAEAARAQRSTPEYRRQRGARAESARRLGY